MNTRQTIKRIFTNIQEMYGALTPNQSAILKKELTKKGAYITTYHAERDGSPKTMISVDIEFDNRLYGIKKATIHKNGVVRFISCIEMNDKDVADQLDTFIHNTLFNVWSK